MYKHSKYVFEKIKSNVSNEDRLKDFEFLNWFGIIASAKTPPEIIRKIQRGIAEVLKQPEMRTRLTADGSEVIGNTPEQFTQFLIADAKKWGPLVGQMGLKVD